MLDAFLPARKWVVILLTLVTLWWERQLDPRLMATRSVTSGPLKSSTQNLILPSVPCEWPLIINKGVYTSFLTAKQIVLLSRNSRKAAQDGSPSAYET